MPEYRSKIAIYELASRSTRVLLERDGIVEAPNWSRDGRFLLVNTAGDLYRLPLAAPHVLEPIALQGDEYSCNNDHDFSPDGRLLAFSARTPDCASSRVFVACADGSDVRLLTPNKPSYFHGWSPDGQWLAFVAERGDGQFELYRAPANGGPEERLTSAGGFDDGPDYSPEGRFIYFNSNRSGSFAIWRMPSGGAGQGDALAERVTFNPGEAWFPHPSPDGKWLVYLCFPAGTAGHDERMPGMELRLLPAPGQRLERSEPAVLSAFFGGQGTINVNSWSPDSSRFAYVIYEPR